MKNNITSIILFLLSYSIACADCILESDMDKISRSQYIFVGKVKAVNTENGDIQKLKNGTILRYLVRPETFLKGYYYSQSPLKFEYSLQRSTRPRQMVFDNEERYIFAVTSITDSFIKLDGFFCLSWGWTMNYFSVLKDIIQNQKKTIDMCMDTHSLEECVDCCTDHLWPASSTESPCPEGLRGSDSFKAYKDRSTLFSESSLMTLCTNFRETPRISSKHEDSCRSTCLSRFKGAN